jgi:putative acetyltransferase
MKIKIRHAEPEDYQALQRLVSGPKVVSGTLQLPFPSAERWRKRLAEQHEGYFNLVACVEDEVVGQLGLSTFPGRPRRRHIGQLGMSVRDDWQGKGVGTAMMEAAIDLADNWLNLSRLELHVYTDNVPAIELYGKFDFTIEGTMVKYAFREGSYVDAYMMARLKA